MDHPLAGRAWDVRTARFVEAAEVERRVLEADIALLGETHDNPVHHELQLRLYRLAVDRGRKPSLVLEQLDTENQAAVEEARGKPGANATTLGEAGKVSRGWQWSLYAPLVDLALDHGLPIVAANLSRTRAREESEKLVVDSVWSPARTRVMRATMVASHCGQDSPIIDRMVVMQRARDAVMAERIAAAPMPVIAVIGRGHAHADLGVPLYLRERAPGRKVLSLAFVEVREDGARPAEYSDAAEGAHDIVWFTPRATREDPCKAG